MDEQVVRQAEDWLEQIYEDLWPTYRKDEAILDVRIANEIKLHSPDLQQAIHVVLRNWLDKDDGICARRALSLILLLRATEFIPALQVLLSDILSGRRSIEAIQYPSSVRNVINTLENEQEEQQ